MSKRTCTVDGCDQPLRCSGFCSSHYSRWRIHGDPQAHKPVKRKAQGQQCEVIGCDDPVRCKGLCSIHYDRMRRHGATSLPPREPLACSVANCDRPHVARGYCGVHKQRLRLTGDVRAHEPVKVMPTKATRNDVVARIADRSIRTDEGCLEWQGPVDRGGYGHIGWQGKRWRIHVATWVVANGPMPDGDWTLDHLCYNRRCSEVAHLERVTRAENTMRAMLRKYAKADRLPEPVLEFLRAASRGTLEGKDFFDAWIDVA